MFVRQDTWLRLVLGAGMLVALPCLAVSQQTPPPDRAILVFRLPAGAKLMIADGETTQSGSERTFITPPLSRTTGKGFTYTVKATWAENGKEKKVERVVRFKAGSRVVVDLTVAEKPADKPRAAQKPREKEKPKQAEKPKEEEKPKEPDKSRETDTSERPERLKLPTPVKGPEKP